MALHGGIDVDQMTIFKVSEMVGPSRTPRPIRGMGMGSMGATGPQFLDASGNPITSIESGQPYGFNVPGYSSVWLILNKDGQQVYNAILALPMALHVAQDSEIGIWQAEAFDPSTGQPIGSVAQFQITAAGASTATTSGAAAWLANLTPTEKLVGAGVIAFLLLRKKRA